MLQTKPKLQPMTRQRELQQPVPTARGQLPILAGLVLPMIQRQFESSESTTMEAPPVGTGSTGSATQGNWLVILASVMSEAAAKHLQAAIGHANDHWRNRW